MTARRCVRACTSRATIPDARQPRNRAIDTNWLTHAAFRPTALQWGWRRWLLLAGASALLLLLAARYGFAGDLFATSRDLAAAREERELLAAEVERLRTELAVETATRGELERHAVEMNARVAELNRQVEFLMDRTASGVGAE